MDEITPDPEMIGPYDPEFGQCAHGHDVNAYGRCESLNNGQETLPSGEEGEAGD